MFLHHIAHLNQNGLDIRSRGKAHLVSKFDASVEEDPVRTVINDADVAVGALTFLRDRPGARDDGFIAVGRDRLSKS